MTALNSQVGGDHYKDQKLQPIELAYMLGGTPCFCKVAKYCTRSKGDHGENIRKAIHCIQLEKELTEYMTYYRTPQGVPYKHTISLFTGEEWLRTALTCVYDRRYNLAIETLEAYLNDGS